MAYQISACAAVEDALGVAVGPQITDLRRLLYCGEWLQSHALHIHMLHAPDFLGCQDAVELARAEPAAFERGLALKKLGNRIMERSVGLGRRTRSTRSGRGSTVAPPRAAVVGAGRATRPTRWAAAAARWVAGFDFPDVDGDYRFVALRHATGTDGVGPRRASSDGLDTTAGAASPTWWSRSRWARSTALHALPRGSRSVPDRPPGALRAERG